MGECETEIEFPSHALRVPRVRTVLPAAYVCVCDGVRESLCVSLFAFQYLSIYGLTFLKKYNACPGGNGGALTREQAGAGHGGALTREQAGAGHGFEAGRWEERRPRGQC